MRPSGVIAIGMKRSWPCSDDNDKRAMIQPCCVSRRMLSRILAPTASGENSSLIRRRAASPSRRSPDMTSPAASISELGEVALVNLRPDAAIPSVMAMIVVEQF